MTDPQPERQPERDQHVDEPGKRHGDALEEAVTDDASARDAAPDKDGA
jgi:hypothetical protein